MKTPASQLTPRIVWRRSNRRQWPATDVLEFSAEERRKRRHVLLYFWGGQGERSVPGGTVTVHARDCHWSRPGFSYACRQEAARPLGITAIHFDLLDATGHPVAPEETVLPPEVLTVRRPALLLEISNLIADLALDLRAGADPDDARLAAAETLFAGALAQLIADSPGERQQSEEVLDWAEVTRYIQEHLADLPSVPEVAYHWGYSRSHFSRLFKAAVGLSPQAYIRNARIALAKELLRETDLSVTDIAGYVGYADIHSFSRRFQQQTSHSPSAYREEN